ncbi:peptide MFS transporter [Pseudolysinimonas sp.]|uniref:peptide MFS transporter n=1 Tax=Pseudolysinimonas sp. TaxID=2680009 RepID=UPI003F80F226
MTDTAAARKQDRGFFGQPRPLATLFGVETWERFSFYGMQGILILYLYFSVADGGLGIPKPVATGIVGAYGGAVYLATILGAWLADRVLGAERTLFASAAVVMLGHIALALLPGLVGVAVGLVLIALGSGGVKANSASILGMLYERGDTRRDAGFSLYYFGVNLGAFFGPLLTGLLQSTLGFHIGFGLAAVGMAAGLLQYAVGRRRLPDAARAVTDPLPASRRLPMVLVAVGALVVIAVLILTGVIRADNLVLVVIGVVIVAAVVYFIRMISDRAISSDERSRVVAFIPLFVVNAVFWSLYQQQFTAVPIYTDERLDRRVFGWEFPIPWVQSINPVFILILSIVFTAIWTRLGARQPSAPVKFALGAIVMGAAFLLFLPFSGTGPHGTPILALVAIILVFTIAELLISPPGLSASTKLAPDKYTTQMVALYYLSISLGTAASGLLAGFYAPKVEVPYFLLIGAAAIVVGLVLLAVARPVLRLMRGVR